ncbi:hypothetical protein, partial [Vibrio cholerae]|uniref:hypothetical protein n=1 Tax=Vibrio cholerae TaxID=666 RepID=UPI001C8D13F0
MNLIALSVAFFSLSTFSYRAAFIAYALIFIEALRRYNKINFIFDYKSILYFIAFLISILVTFLFHDVNFLYFIKFLGMLIFVAILYLIINKCSENKG